MKQQEQKLEDNGYNLEDEDILLIDDEAYNESLVGVTDDGQAVYDKDLMVEEFSKHHGCSQEDALEYIDYNIVRALPYFGEKAPILFNRLY